MSYNGSGTFQINTSGQPVVTGTSISSTVFNALTADLATGLSTAITKDGQTTTTARIPFALGINSTLVTDATNTTSGSIITAGGVGIAKALYVGTTANVAGAVTLGGVATFSAQPIFSSLTASSAVATDASKGLVSVTNTGTGNNVLATAPTIASLNLTTALTIASASGTVGQALTSGGSGNAPTWSTIAATPGGSTTQVQYNNAGAFGGISGATTNGTALTLTGAILNGTIGATTPATGAFTTVSAAGKISSLWSISTGDGILVRDTGDTSGASFLAFQNSSGGYIGLISRDALTNNMQLKQVSGITFPATQSASTDANTLDDYEEGTWTPVIGGSGGTSGQTYSTQTGTYTKIGRQVTCNFVATLSAKGTITANLQIQGLPFTSGIGYSAICFAWWYLAASTTVVWLGGSTAASNTVATIYAATVATASSGNNLTTADIGNSCQLQGTIIYTV